MNRLYILLFLVISIEAYSNHNHVTDTISYWKVYNGGKLIKEGNVFDIGPKILLKKAVIRSVDSLNVKYFDDTPCINCKGALTIKSEQGKVIKIIGNTISNYDFKIKTTDLQVLAFKNRNSILRFYYKEDSIQDEILLFEIEIR